MPAIQWYPGHIAKLERQLDALLKTVDVVVTVVDARLPLASVNPRLEKRLSGKPVLTLLNKSDLADPAQNRLLLKHFAATCGAAMLYDSLNPGRSRQQVITQLVALGEARMQQIMAKGLKRRPVRVLVAGMPNVGKSSVINSLVGRRKTQTGHKAGVTRQPQWVRIHERIELLDTPGIIPPRLERVDDGALLAAVSSVGEAAYDEESVALFLLERIAALYPGLLQGHYKMSASRALSLESVAESRQYRASGAQPDLLRAAQAILSDFRQGRLGRLTLERLTPDEPKPGPAQAKTAEVPGHPPEDGPPAGPAAV